MAFAALICLEARKLSFGTARTPGPGLLPLGYGTLLFLLAGIFVFKTGFKGGRLGESASAPWAALKWRRVACTLAGLLVYALLLDRLGYLVCTGVLLVFLFWGKGTRRRSMAILGGWSISIVSYIAFRIFLKVQLPSGFLGI